MRGVLGVDKKKGEAVRFLARGGMFATVLAFGLVALAPSGSTAVGDCVTVKGKGGKKKNGYANVCLLRFDDDGKTQYARVKVTQYQRSAPKDVYVKGGFTDEGTYSPGDKRLGENANEDRQYKKTRTFDNPFDMDGFGVKICYDKFGTDPCFRRKILWGE